MRVTAQLYADTPKCCAACCPCPGSTAPLCQVIVCVRMMADLLHAEDPAYKMAPKPTVVSRFKVLPGMIGPAIIGKSGTHAKHIRERTGVRIEVVREYCLPRLLSVLRSLAAACLSGRVLCAVLGP